MSLFIGLKFQYKVAFLKKNDPLRFHNSIFDYRIFCIENFNINHWYDFGEAASGRYYRVFRFLKKEDFVLFRLRFPDGET